MTETEAIEGATSRHELRGFRRDIINSKLMHQWVCWCPAHSHWYPTENQARAAHSRHQDRAVMLTQLFTQQETP